MSWREGLAGERERLRLGYSHTQIRAQERERERDVGDAVHMKQHSDADFRKVELRSSETLRTRQDYYYPSSPQIGVSSWGTHLSR